MISKVLESIKWLLNQIGLAEIELTRACCKNKLPTSCYRKRVGKRKVCLFLRMCVFIENEAHSTTERVCCYIYIVIWGA